MDHRARVNYGLALAIFLGLFSLCSLVGACAKSIEAAGPEPAYRPGQAVTILGQGIYGPSDDSAYAKGAYKGVGYITKQTLFGCRSSWFRQYEGTASSGSYYRVCVVYKIPGAWFPIEECAWYRFDRISPR